MDKEQLWVPGDDRRVGSDCRKDGVTLSWKKARFILSSFLESDHLAMFQSDPRACADGLATEDYVNEVKKKASEAGSLTAARSFVKKGQCSYGYRDESLDANAMIIADNKLISILGSECSNHDAKLGLLAWSSEEDKVRAMISFARFIHPASDFSRRRTPFRSRSSARFAECEKPVQANLTDPNKLSINENMAIMRDVVESLTGLSRKHNLPMSSLFEYFDIANAMSRPHFGP